MPDRIGLDVADGAPIEGDLVAVIDESSSQNASGGVTYVVAIAALFDPARALAELGRLLSVARRQSFHWEREGTSARTRIIEMASEIGVVAAAHYAHVGRRGRSRARQAMLADMVPDAAADGVDHLVIEASDAATVGRDRVTLLRTFEETGGVPISLRLAVEGGAAVVVADAIARAAGEHLIGKDDTWWQMLDDDTVDRVRS